MICPVRLANEMSASGRGGRSFVLTGGQHEALFGSGRGADDENPRGDLTGSGREVTVVASSRDCGGELPDDAALAVALPGAWLRWTLSPSQGQAEPQAGAARDGGEGVAAVSTGVCGSQRAAFSSEVGV